MSIPIEQVITPHTETGADEATLRIADRHLVFQDLAFCSNEFAARHWKDATFAKLTASDLPFTVTKSGSMLGLNLLHGIEVDGDPYEQVWEIVKLYGDIAMFPRAPDDVRAEALADFAASTRLERPSPDGTVFRRALDAISDASERSVLVLGSYQARHLLQELRAALVQLGYEPFLLIDEPDVEHQTNTEKLLLGIMSCRFVVILDSVPSGHIAEIEQLLQLRFRPTIVVRPSGRPSTRFLDDRIRNDDMFRIIECESMDCQELASAYTWASMTLESNRTTYNEINSWRLRKDG